MKSVLAVSGIGIDTIVRVPNLPLPDVDVIHVPPIIESVAHAGNGIALGFRALGRPITMVDVIGDDPEGERIRALYRERGIPFIADVHPSGTRRSVNLVEPGGRRMSLHDGRHPYEYVPPAELWREPLESADHVHTTIVNWARHAQRDAIERGKTTSTDLQDWDGDNEHHREFALGSDIVFMSATNLGDRREEIVGRIFRDGRAQIVAVTMGVDGSVVYQRDQDPIVQPAIHLPDRPAVDSNGAGDSYAAAFLDAWLDGTDVETCAHIGALAGSWACGTAGTHSSFISREDRDRLLSA